MGTEFIRKPDLRSVEELIHVAVNEADEDLAWEAVSALHLNGTLEVFQRAEKLCRSQIAQERRRGADILGQLGSPDWTFPEECIEQLSQMLSPDENAEVLRSVLIALSHHDNLQTVPLVAEFSTHSDPEVRHATVLALMGHADPLAIERLILLSRDPEAHVRDWAVFALGTQLQIDTSEIRSALWDRVDDPDDDTRAEALVGLAQRKDERVIALLKRELSSGCVGALAVEAAELIASAELYSELVKLQDWWDVSPCTLGNAVSASKPSASSS